LDQNELTPASLATRHQTSVAVTLGVQWRMLTDRNAKLLLKLASFFPIGEFVSQSRLGLLSATPAATSRIRRPLEATLNKLSNLSLIERHSNGQSIRLHPLVRDFANRKIRKRNLASFKSKAASNLMTEYADPNALLREYEARGIDEVIGDID